MLHDLLVLAITETEHLRVFYTQLYTCELIFLATYLQYGLNCLILYLDQYNPAAYCVATLILADMHACFRSPTHNRQAANGITHGGTAPYMRCL